MNTLINRYIVAVFSACLLLVNAQSAMAQEEQDIENIEVKGQRSLLSLERTIVSTRKDFYDIFNKHNTESKFDMVCRVKKGIGSNLAQEICEPRYLKDARDRITRDRAASGMSIDISRVPDEETVQLATKQEQQESLVHMQKLLEDVPELREKYIELHGLVARYQERKAEKD